MHLLLWSLHWMWVSTCILPSLQIPDNTILYGLDSGRNHLTFLFLPLLEFDPGLTWSLFRLHQLLITIPLGAPFSLSILLPQVLKSLTESKRHCLLAAFLFSFFLIFFFYMLHLSSACLCNT